MELKKNKSFKVENIEASKDNYFVNPIFPHDAPDPYITYDNKYGYYYLLYSQGDKISITRSKTISDLNRCVFENKVVFEAGNNGIYGCIWAPEMHKIGDKWYIYTSGTPVNHEGNPNAEGFVLRDYKMFVLESKTDNPFDGFDFANMFETGEHSIDPTIYQHTDGKLYLVNATDGHIHMREMVSPTELSDKTSDIAEPIFDYETVRPCNEGPFFIRNGNRLFLIYSANDCFIDEYCLGCMEFVGDDIMDKNSWKKDEVPLLTQGNGNYGPGHASFFKSPDGKNLYVAYHAMHEGWHAEYGATRYLHIQKVHFDETGFPHIGAPAKIGERISEPN